MKIERATHYDRCSSCRKLTNHAYWIEPFDALHTRVLLCDRCAQKVRDNDVRFKLHCDGKYSEKRAWVDEQRKKM